MMSMQQRLPAHSVSARLRLVIGMLVAVGLSTSSCVNPNLVNQSGGELYPLAPGDQPYVLVTLINKTTASLSGQVLVDEGATTPLAIGFQNFLPGVTTKGILLPYPFLRVAVGNLDNPLAPSILATLPDGVTVLVPFGQTALVAGTDFKRGDTILFEFVADARSPTAITISTGIVDGSTQVGPFSREDTFQTVTALLLANGLDTNFLASPSSP
jgi:hypothetical protein